MKNILFPIFIMVVAIAPVIAQKEIAGHTKQEILAVIDQYSQARETQDTLLLKSILTEDVDQLVSTGEWRVGIREGISGMLRSSTTNPGDRTIVVDKIRMLDKKTAIADARYKIKDPGGDLRKMWSTFILVRVQKQWKIAGIRNMLPKGY